MPSQLPIWLLQLAVLGRGDALLPHPSQPETMTAALVQLYGLLPAAALLVVRTQTAANLGGHPQAVANLAVHHQPAGHLLLLQPKNAALLLVFILNLLPFYMF